MNGIEIVLALLIAPASSATTLNVQTRRSRHELRSGTTYRIGRDPGCDIKVNDARVSGQHAVLYFDGSGWMLEDTSGGNGMFLGGQRVERVKITQYCSIRLAHPDNGPILRFEPMPATGVPAPSGAEHDLSAHGMLADAEHEISDALTIDEDAGLADVRDRMRGQAEPETE
jgi:pSer/pThr/pTyr-binding forkhead associated (FHA) protein